LYHIVEVIKKIKNYLLDNESQLLR